MAIESLDEVRSDIAHHRKKLVQSGLPPEVRSYFESTVYPLLDTLVGNLDTKIDEQDAALDELIEGEGELLHGETAQQMIETLALAGEIIASLKTRAPTGDPVWAQIEEFGVRSTKVIEKIAEITVDDVGQEEGGGEADEEEEDDDGDDE